MSRKEWLVALAIAAVVVMAYESLVRRTSRRDSDGNEAFLRVYRLTPIELLTRCGEARHDGTGVITENDGIRDLHYDDTEGRDLVFRFADANARDEWQPLGVWQDVHGPFQLGSQVNHKEVMASMPCLVSPSPQTAHSWLDLGGVAWASTRDASFSATALAAKAEDLKLANLPEELASGSPRAAGNPCPPDVSCRVVDTNAFSAELNRQLTPGRSGNFAQFLSAAEASTAEVLAIRLPADEAERTVALRNVLRLEVQRLNIMAVRLRSDEQRLLPSQQEPREDRNRKLRELVQDEHQRIEMWKAAVEEAERSLAAPAVVVQSRGGRDAYATLRHGDAFRQLVQAVKANAHLDAN